MAPMRTTIITSLHLAHCPDFLQKTLHHYHKHTNCPKHQTNLGMYPQEIDDAGEFWADYSRESHNGQPRGRD